MPTLETLPQTHDKLTLETHPEALEVVTPPVVEPPVVEDPKAKK